MCEHIPDPASSGRWLDLPDDPLAAAALEVVDRLRAAGHAAFVVGGCVRDLVAGLSPKDWDVATGALPPQVRQVFGRVIEVGVSFGVLRVPVCRAGVRFEVEVATFRADGPYSDGRHPDEVRFTSAREDVLRRDFTLNGLLLDPGPTDSSGHRRGQILDWVGGVADMDAGVLRAIGRAEDRFAEDGLRILRAVRFAARFSLRLEEDTRRALVAQAAGLAAVSRERIRSELAGALRLPWAPDAVRLLGELGLHGVIWPQLAKKDPQLRGAHERVSILCDLLLAASTAASPASDRLTGQRALDLPLALAILLDDIRPTDRAGVIALARDLRLSGDDGRRLGRIWELSRGCLSLHQSRSKVGVGVEPAKVAGDPHWIRLLRAPDADAALLLLASRGANGAPELRADWLALRAVRATASALRWSPQLWVSGQTLRKFGHQPSPRFKPALQAAEDVQLSGGDRDQALAAALASLGDD